MPQLNEDRPIYLQLKEYIEGEILEGRLGDDEQIPSTNELAAFFGINPITALKGVTMLTDEGILYKKRGVGMFVNPGACKVIQRQYRATLADESILPLVRRARLLGMTSSELTEAIAKTWEQQEAQQDTEE